MKHFIHSLPLLFLFLGLPLSAENTPAPLPSSEDTKLEASLAELKQQAPENPAATRQVYMRYAASGHAQLAQAWADEFIRQLEEKANAGDVQAAWLLGHAWMTGESYRTPDTAKAISWFSKAAEAGEPSAAYIIGELHTKAKRGQDAAKAFAHAYSLYKKLADEGNAEALYWQGYMEQNGLGTKADPATGIAHMETAAQQGCHSAAYQLFKTYTKGLGAPANETKSIEYARLLADKANDGVMAYVVADAYFKGKGVAKDETLAHQYLDKAAGLNIADAIYHKAWLLEEAGKVEEALPLYRQATTMGHPDSAVRAGVILLYGRGTEKDESLGLSFLQRATDVLQSPIAPYELGLYYDSIGESTLADNWFITASDRGLAQAMARRGLLHLIPFTSVHWSPTEAYRWWTRGSNANDDSCKLYLRLYLFVFIPLVLIFVFGFPVLVVHRLNKRASKEETKSEA